MELQVEKKASSPMTTPTHTHFWAVSPILKLSPKHGGSTLYDSFELRAITHQLNKAIQGSKSPFYHQQLDRIRIHRENVKTPRRISLSARDNKKMSMTDTSEGSGGFVTRLWKKVKQGLLRNKQKKDH
jgi:hypothetical protein